MMNTIKHTVAISFVLGIYFLVITNLAYTQPLQAQSGGTLSCWEGLCTGDSDCGGDLVCSLGACVNPSCPTLAMDTNQDCICNNDLCYEDIVATPIPAPPANATIFGKVFIDTNGNCIYDAGVDSIAGGTASLTLTQTYPFTCSLNTSVNANASGDYSFNGLSCFDSSTPPSSNYNLQATYTNLPSELYNFNFCHGGSASTNYPVNGVNPGENAGPHNFALTAMPGPWLQTYGTGMHIGSLPGHQILNEIPATASTTFVTSDFPVNYYGADIIGGMASGVVSVGFSPSNVSLGGSTVGGPLWGNYQQSLPERMLFSRIKRDIIENSGLLDVTLTSTNPTITINQPVTDTDLNGIIIVHATKPVEMLAIPWLIEKPTIIVVDGSFTINENILLGPSGFLMVATSTDVIVTSGVGVSLPNSASTNLEGLFITGRDFRVLSHSIPDTLNLRINIKGSIVTGTNDVSGSYRSTRSNGSDDRFPSDFLVYNPKLILNAPRILSEPIYTWSEKRDTEPTVTPLP